VRVRFFAYIRNFTGCAEADFPHEETVGALARTLCTCYGEKLRQKIFPDNKILDASGTEQFGQEIIILINGRHVNHLGGPSAPLEPDDRVDIFPIVAGG
jgi:molybdopterin synthase sulfur carrier subunit